MVRPIVIWGYLVEVILAILVTMIFYTVFNFNKVNTFIQNSAIELAAIVGGTIFAAALAFLWAIFAKTDSDFYQWLASKGAGSVYLVSVAYCAFISMSLIITLILAKHTKNDHVSFAALFLLCLAIINIFTLIKNVIDVIKLNMAFNSINAKGSDSET